jgi:hypothetical protein
MSLDHTVQEHASDVCRAVMAANKCGDPTQCAFDIVGAAVLVAGDDEATKSALAWFLLRTARQLDHDLTTATVLQ